MLYMLIFMTYSVYSIFPQPVIYLIWTPITSPKVSFIFIHVDVHDFLNLKNLSPKGTFCNLDTSIKAPVFIHFYPYIPYRLFIQMKVELFTFKRQRPVFIVVLSQWQSRGLYRFQVQ